ncbi:MAG: hypothetical protein NZT92_17370 [Abditibacteriales bacterium]|nr:hypothetical protein [Abditibacteriales bacterium]MDW8367619.1 hypothetical protein [Abditibacteriales bacterium]
MLATPHLLTGALIGQATGNYPLAFACGVMSHFALDGIPHTEPSTFLQDPHACWKWNVRVAVVDVLLGLALLCYLLPHASHPGIAAWGALGAVFPDLVSNIPLWQKRIWNTWWGRPFLKFHAWIHYSIPRRYWPLGILTQVATVAVVLCLWK